MRTFIPTLLTGLVAGASAETWAIQNLTSHFMGRDSGLPGGQWPPGDQFNSTVNFNLVIESNTTATVACAANWTPPNYPTNYIVCGQPNVKFRFEQKGDFNEGQFTLDLVRSESVVKYVTLTATRR